MKKVLGYTVNFDLSNHKNKKYMVHIKELDSTVHFGDSRYKHYHTNSLIYKNQPQLYVPEWEHHDKKRRLRYRQRAKWIKNKTGLYTVTDILSPNFWSYNFLW